MSFKYVDQSSGKLNYLFILSPIEIADNFKVLRKKTYVRRFGKLIIAIIGESHVIQIKDKDINFTEILAYVKNKDLYGISRKRFYIRNYQKVLKYAYMSKFFRYYFSVKRQKVGPVRLKKLLSNIKKYDSRDKLFFKWPDKNDSREFSFTFIKHRLSNAKRVMIETQHFYQNEGVLVSTLSDIKIV